GAGRHRQREGLALPRSRAPAAPLRRAWGSPIPLACPSQLRRTGVTCASDPRVAPHRGSDPEFHSLGHRPPELTLARVEPAAIAAAGRPRRTRTRSRPHAPRRRGHAAVELAGLDRALAPRA